jgi:hypothetical protein
MHQPPGMQFHPDMLRSTAALPHPCFTCWLVNYVQYLVAAMLDSTAA